MSITLGEKLRQAREERGISISEVAEQTRISPHYLDSIENDDYRTLPGGIFNKGFVKSYAKYVGVDEQEALQDYASLISSQESSAENIGGSYRPEVLTDDRNSGSMVPTIIFAIIILALMSGGVLMLVNYIQSKPSQQANATPAANSNLPSSDANTSAPVSSATPDEIKIEFKSPEAVDVTATIDGKAETSRVTPDASRTYSGKDSVKLRYYRGFADRVQITVNGKKITPPPAPPKGVGIEFEINKSNVVAVMQTGQIPGNAAPAANANVATAR